MRWRIAILLAVITTINYIDRSVFGVVVPVVLGEFGIGGAYYGLITSGFSLAYSIGQLISGPLIDWLGTKRAFSLATVFWSVATPACHGPRTVELFRAAIDSGYCRGGELSGCQQSGRPVVSCQ